MRNSLMLGLAWVLATVVAVLAASAAVQVVARQVADDLPPPLPAEYLPDATRSATPVPAEVTATPPAPTPTAEPAPTPTAEPAPTTPPMPDMVGETRTVQAIGGSAGLRFSDGIVQVLWATPNGGYTASVEGAGTDEVVVEFRSEDNRSRITARSTTGVPDIDVTERGEPEEGDEGDERED